jgi:large subunit ribosomal protein L25
METLSFQVSKRVVLGKKVKELRRQGLTPLHLYGKGAPSVFLQADSPAVADIVKQVGNNIPLNLSYSEAETPDLVFVREIQRHPISNQILHVDFYRIDVTQKVRGVVPIFLQNESPAVRIHGGVLSQLTHSLSVECLPMDMPERIDIDISVIEIPDQAIRVSDFITDNRITVLADPEEIIARVTPPRVAQQQELADQGDEVPGPVETISQAEDSGDTATEDVG